MKKIIFSAILALGLSANLFAALPPLAQSIKEINAILSSQELNKYFTQADYIEEIKHLDESYVVTSQNKRVIVDIVYQPSQVQGPREFKLVFHPATPLGK